MYGVDRIMKAPCIGLAGVALDANREKPAAEPAAANQSRRVQTFLMGTPSSEMITFAPDSSRKQVDSPVAAPFCCFCYSAPDVIIRGE